MAWNAICNRCGSKKLNHQLRLEWTGLRVCATGCWEARHPLDSVRAKPDRQNPPWVSPEADDVFVGQSFYYREDGSLIMREDGIYPLLREGITVITHDP